MDASSRLIGYFPLLQWALGSSPSNKKLVDVQVLYDLFVDLDNWRLEMDENKRVRHFYFTSFVPHLYLLFS